MLFSEADPTECLWGAGEVSFGPLTPGSEKQSRLLWLRAGFFLLEEAAICLTHSEAESDMLFAGGNGESRDPPTGVQQHPYSESGAVAQGYWPGSALRGGRVGGFFVMIRSYGIAWNSYHLTAATH